MANWINVLDIKNEWDKVINNKIGTEELATIIAHKLSHINKGCNERLIKERDEIVADFIKFVACSEDTDEFDKLMNRLYDWGDTDIDGCVLYGRKLCWIQTF